MPLELAKFLDYFIIGLILGGVFALVAVGYSLVYGIIKLINFAHGEVAMFGAFFAYMALGWQIGVETGGSPQYWIAVFVGVFLLVFLPGLFVSRLRTKGSQFFLVLTLIGAGLIWWLSQYPNDQLNPSAYLKALCLTLVLTIILGCCLEWSAYRPLRHASRLSALITTIGMSLVMQNAAAVIWGPEDNRVTPPAFFNETLFYIGDPESPDPDLIALEITYKPLVIMILVLAAMFFLWWVVEKTRLGKAMRACSQDLSAAALMGINIDRVVAFTFVLGAGMAALSGYLMSTHIPVVRYDMGVQIGIVAFAAAVLGGIGSIPGAILGGFLIGFSQSFAAGYLSEFGQWIGHPSITAGYKESVAFLIMILFLIFKPSGLLGKQEADRA